MEGIRKSAFEVDESFESLEHNDRSIVNGIRRRDAATRKSRDRLRRVK